VTEVLTAAVREPSEDIVVEADGTIRFVYSDTLATLFEGGELQTTRASHVEPAINGRAGWTADMAPLCGPVLFADGAGSAQDAQRVPFTTRQQALDAEREWIRKELGL
jgi:hypothetical protein